MPETSTPSVRHSNPIDTLILRTNNSQGQSSLLDTIIISRQSHRAVYATTTRGPKTSLYKVALNGTLGKVAQINWEHQTHNSGGNGITNAGDGSLKRVQSLGKKAEVMVIFAGRMVKAEEFLRRGRGWFPSDSRLTTIGDEEYKWKSGSEDINTKNSTVKNQKSSYHDVWKIWRCIASPKRGQAVVSEDDAERNIHASTSANISHPPNSLYPSSSTTVPPPTSIVSLESLEVQGLSSNAASIRADISLILTAPAPPNLLVRFVPPQSGLPRSEITLFPPILDSPDPSNALHTLEHLLLSAILLTVAKGDWKKIQSENDSAALQAILIAEAAGDVPPYTPTFGRTIERGPGHPFEEVDRRNWARSRPNERPVTGTSRSDIPDYDGEDSDQIPLLGRNPHQTTRSIPQRRSNVTNSPNRRTFRNNSTQPSTSAPPTARNPSRAGDGIFASPRRSLQDNRPSSSVVRRVPLGERHLNNGEMRSGIERGTIPRRPMTSPPPVYKQ